MCTNILGNGFAMWNPLSWKKCEIAHLLEQVTIYNTKEQVLTCRIHSLENMCDYTTPCIQSLWECTKGWLKDIKIKYFNWVGYSCTAVHINAQSIFQIKYKKQKVKIFWLQLLQLKPPPSCSWTFYCIVYELYYALAFLSDLPQNHCLIRLIYHKFHIYGKFLQLF